MKWDKNLVKNLTNEDIMRLSIKDLQSLDKYYTMTVRERLKHTQKLGTSPAEAVLHQAGIITDVDKMKAINSTDRMDITSRIQALKSFTSKKTSRVSGYKSYIKSREILTKDRGLSPTVMQVVDELKRRGIYRQLLDDDYGNTFDIIEHIENIIESEDDIDMEKVISRVKNESDAFNRIPEDEFGFNMNDDIDELNVSLNNIFGGMKW